MEEFFNDLVCVLVLYKCSLSESKTYSSINDSLISLNITSRPILLVYNNSPLYHIDINKSDNWKVIIINDNTNSGVSKAYNEGAKLAKQYDKKWLLLLDQDTHFELNSLERYYDSTQKYKKYNVFLPILLSDNSIISPAYYINKRASMLKKVDIGISTLKHRTFLNSGLLISVYTFYSVHGYEETIPLYFSDLSFSEKLSDIKEHFVVLDTRAKHSLNSKDGTNKDTFILYCRGAKQFFLTLSLYGKFCLITMVLLRSIKLTVKYRSNYMKLLFNSLFT